MSSLLQAVHCPKLNNVFTEHEFEKRISQKDNRVEDRAHLTNYTPSLQRPGVEKKEKQMPSKNTILARQY